MEANLFTFRGIFGVPVEVRQSAGLLFLMMVTFSVIQGGGLLNTAIIFSALFIAVYLHELGHAWGARVQGLRVKGIVIHAGGGWCEHERGPEASEELVVAMGPIVNLALWAICAIAVKWLYHKGLGDPEWVPTAMSLIPWLGFFAMLNLFLFCYNMVPVQPLDGGKLIRIWLRRLMPAAKASRVAGTIGVVFCVLWFPGLLLVFLTTGWLLFFVPSLALHRAMMRGEIR
ncbi:site-2 protease family protein [Gemmobacter serpentinus]|uniref:site-2 protease family protein n=1 Tax=Gemmobacter serpentinus TaxID=2652247 RepID=UPI00124E1EE2|nr:site-2 protease family protein [Gemmobacter serpentinus]